jgi:hypothetical protein
LLEQGKEEQQTKVYDEAFTEVLIENPDWNDTYVRIFEEVLRRSR